MNCKVHLTATENVPGDIDCRCPRRTSPCDRIYVVGLVEERISREFSQNGINRRRVDRMQFSFSPAGNRTRELRNSIILSSHFTISIQWHAKPRLICIHWVIES